MQVFLNLRITLRKDAWRNALRFLVFTANSSLRALNVWWLAWLLVGLRSTQLVCASTNAQSLSSLTQSLEIVLITARLTMISTRIIKQGLVVLPARMSPLTWLMWTPTLMIVPRDVSGNVPSTPVLTGIIPPTLASRSALLFPTETTTRGCALRPASSTCLSTES